MGNAIIRVWERQRGSLCPENFPALKSGVGEKRKRKGYDLGDSGPIYPDVLILQESHVSDHIGSGQPVPDITMIKHFQSHSAWVIEDARVLALISQDVTVMLGLRIDGSVVTGTDDHSWPEVCARLLGQVSDLRSGAMKLSWLRQTFQGDIPEDASMETLQFHAHAYILHMIGCVLFPDASKTLVHARWLPLLEDFDNKEFKGCCTLIQIWSWERIHIGRPTLLVHRDSPYQTSP
ncbi:protein MAIN-LIKE 1-like [Asparagus officinalis]|uniref:protein MAIN-LIKE 1-like n=1 Tax=Asparagus officinalis TaxID=4686 RepID=UPI00098DF765|nr:protein MAIN-LIKE 1-like [Asparagus officinalis]